MKRIRLLKILSFIFGVILLPVCLFAADAPKTQKTSSKDLPIQNLFAKRTAQVEAVADHLEYSQDNKTIIAKGNVVVRHQEVHLTSDEAEVETDTKKVHAKGHVIVFRNNEPIARGNEISFDFEHQTGSFPDGKILTVPWIISGEDIQQVKKGKHEIKNGTITTCYLDKPHWKIVASKVTVYENDKMIARNIKVYVLKKPIFWWPYLIIPLQSDNVPFQINVGYNSRFGGFIETTKGIAITKQISGKIHNDWRSKRGYGGGGDLEYRFEKMQTHGIVKGYLTRDKRAPNVSGEKDVAFQSLQPRTRGRFTWLNRTDIDPYTNILARYNRIEDEFFLQDFFYKESRAEIEPQSFVAVTKNSDRYGLLANVERKMNRFESLVERQPQLRFDWKEQPFLKPWIFYENQYGYDNLSTQFRRTDYNEDVNRFDGFNEWSVPLKWKEIKFTPFTNLGGTYYTRNRESTSDRFRATFGFGTDLRTQFYKTYPVTFDKAGIEVNHLRHVLEPSVQYKSLKPSMQPSEINHFDSKDRIDDSDTITFGIENRIQTKRVVNGRMQRVDLVSFNTFLSYERREDAGDYASNLTTTDEGRTPSDLQGHTSILSQQVVLRPYEWLNYQLRLDHDVRQNEFRAFNQDVLFKLGKYKVVFGHRYINSIGQIAGSDQFVFDGRWVINPLWTVGGYFRWDIEASGRDEWQISATRDLHDFILDFGYNVRNSAIQSSSNKEVYFSFRLKAFPGLALRSGSRSEFSEPRIGETVAGANQATLPAYQLNESY